ncbi:YeiH family protein [Polaromonas sp.]|uniref:YeiH family protein n=1 Tax=Polaromonas sp. TaxID=1869339 RepID=UPI002FC5A52B
MSPLSTVPNAATTAKSISTPAPLVWWRDRLLSLLPLGLLAALTLVLTRWSALAGTGLSALTLAMGLGMLAGNLLPRRWLAPLAPGAGLARQQLLRLGVALYGLRLTFGAVVALGAAGVVVPLLMLAGTLLAGLWLGTRLLGLGWREALVISAGSAVCGAAAAIAVASVVRTDDRQTAVAVATVVLFGTLGMFLYPSLHELAVQQWQWPVSARLFGIFTGATLHEVAQVIASGQMVGPAVADAAVVAKMVRVLALAPLLLLIALWPQGAKEAAAPGTASAGLGRPVLKCVPWFALGFIAIMALHSAGWVPAEWKPALIVFDDWLLACAMLAIGLHTRLSDLLHAGRRPLVLAGLLFVFLISAGALLCWAVA